MNTHEVCACMCTSLQAHVHTHTHTNSIMGLNGDGALQGAGVSWFTDTQP